MFGLHFLCLYSILPLPNQYYFFVLLCKSYNVFTFSFDNQIFMAVQKQFFFSTDFCFVYKIRFCA